MATRTVRLDEQTERTLQRLRRDTGFTISDVLKRGVEAFATHTQSAAEQTPYDVYRRIALGRGGWAKARARDAKREVRAVIARKHGR